MIVDCHTHIWQTADQLGQADLGGAASPAVAVRPANKRRGAATRSGLRRIPPADPERHWQSALPVDRSVVLAYTSRLLRAEVPNAYVADYVRRHPDKLVGFAGVDPTDPAALDQLAQAAESGLRGLVLSPSGQGFHPADSRAMDLLAEADRRRMPVVFHPGGHLAERAHLEYARPVLLDEVARGFPSLRIVVAQLGQPWVEETATLLAKHRHVYADIGGLCGRPWRAYTALVTCHEQGVINRLLFASDFPFADAAGTIERLFSTNLIVQGTPLPTVPREALRGIVERDALSLLNLA